MFRCGCYGQFDVTLKKKEEVLLSFTVFHGTGIGSKELMEESQIKVDEKALAPFYAQIVERTKKKYAKSERGQTK